MTIYAAPLRDMGFVIHELVGLEPMCAWPAFGELGAGLVDEVIAQAGRFGAEVLAPLNAPGDREGARWHDGEVSTPAGFAQAYRQYVEAGWQGLSCASELGGQGLPRLVGAAVQEIWKASNHAWSVCQALTMGGIEALLNNGSPEQTARLLPRLIDGRWSATMNLTEPQAGSDLSRVRTRAIRQADGSYRIFGQKIFISFGEHDMSENIVHFVLARTDDAPSGTRGISLFIVPRLLPRADGSPGPRNDVRCLGIERKLGLHGSPTCTMSYGENGGALGELIGRENEGLKCMFSMMNSGRLSAGLEGLGVAERAMQQALAYARTRIQGRDADAPLQEAAIIRHPDVRRMLMLMRSRVEAMRALAYWTAAAQDAAAHHPDPGQRTLYTGLVDLMTPVVKGWCTETGLDVAQLGIQVHGGTGFIEDTGAAQHLRDLRVSTIYEGTTGIQAQDLVGRKLVRDGARSMRELIRRMRETAAGLQSASLGAAGSGTAAPGTAAPGDAHPAPTAGHAALEADLRAIGAALAEGIDELAAATEWLVAGGGHDARRGAVGAVSFLHLAGIVSGGWMSARAAGIAARRLAAGSDDAFYRSKMVTARFYADHVLVQANMHRRIACCDDASALGIADAQL